ncbi:alpha-amylase family protein [Novosphingobium bradum]|uniref:Alpha-amylase family protein n=1 Tax=Novosphingobium bradum TaxID=1737444 RepID=A0ABV7IPU9_9SPHN
MLSAGGHVAFYPSRIPDQRIAPQLGGRDFFGDLVKASRDDGLEVLARLSLRGSPELVAKYPDWANVDAKGKRLATPCMNGGYFYTYGADIVREVAHRYRPSGFTLSGWGPNYALCYCERCTSLFKQDVGEALPRARNWDDPLFRRWIEWNGERVLALWDYSNKVAQDAGGPDCLWLGQLIGSMLTRNLKRIAERAPLMMIDHQAPEDESGLADNSVFARTLNGLVDWKKPITIASALYAPRLTSPHQDELSAWMYEGMAGGARPWWNGIGGYSQDKRRFPMLPPILQWHERNQEYLFDRRPVATVGLVWSDTNNIFHGRDAVGDLVRSPFQGMVNALIRARIPFVVVHADNLDRDAAALTGIVLPNLAAMTDEQIQSVQRFAARGGGILATGNTSRLDRYGSARADFALADIFGAHVDGAKPAPPPAKGLTEDVLGYIQTSMLQGAGSYVPKSLIAENSSPQSLLRLNPSLRRNAAGPHRADEPPVAPGIARHPALAGFDATDLIYFGGNLGSLRVDSNATVLLTYVPPVATNPPEDAVLQSAPTDLPGLVVHERADGGRTAFLPADIDRQYERHNHPDHADLLANLVRWIARDSLPVTVEGHGLFDCNLYRQPTRMILHVTNLNNAGAWRKPIEDPVAVGPLDVRVRLAAGIKPATARLLVADKPVALSIADGWASARIPSILIHEVLVIE